MCCCVVVGDTSPRYTQLSSVGAVQLCTTSLPYHDSPSEIVTEDDAEIMNFTTLYLALECRVPCADAQMLCNCAPPLKSTTQVWIGWSAINRA